MKRTAVNSMILSLLLLLTVSCATSLEAAGQIESSEPDQTVKKADPLADEVPIIRMEALVDIADDGSITLIEKWGSKSRVTYDVIGDLGKLLRLCDDEIITADVIILGKTNPWHGSLVLVSVIGKQER